VALSESHVGVFGPFPAQYELSREETVPKILPVIIPHSCPSVRDQLK
jgi:hypothetical protein